MRYYRLSAPIFAAKRMKARQNSGRFYYPQIDGLRFVAFALVMLHHGAAPPLFFLQKVNQIGWAGVDIFLVLSAFLIFSILFIEDQRRGTISLRRFYLRRVLRIWPLYYPYLIIALVMSSATHEHHLLVLEQHALPFLMFLGNFSFAYFPVTFDPLYSHLWTVCLEEQFYLVAPFLVLVFGQRLRQQMLPAVCILIAISMIWRIYMLALVPYPMVWVNPVTRIDPFAIGALCAAIVHRRAAWLSLPGIGFALALAGASGFVLIAQSPWIGLTLQTTWQLTVAALSGGCFVLSCLSNWGIGRLLSWGPLPFLGKISFGLYVYHAISLKLSSMLNTGGSSYAAEMSMAFAICIAISAASYLLYERRFLQLKTRFETVQSRPP